MNENSFHQTLDEKGITLTSEQLEQFKLYYDMLIEWNKKMNLTAITEKGDVFLKHFYDSVTPSFYVDIQDVHTICDVGAGAGFPSIPLKICFPHLQITIVDSLKKRIHFLEQLTEKLKLSDVYLVHSRAEEFGQMKQYRESFDIVTARAVANLTVLCEYCIPLCKINGLFLALKGANVDEEINEAKKAINVLGGELATTHSFTLPVEASERSIVVIKKVQKTRKKYPRKPGTPAKFPIV